MVSECKRQREREILRWINRGKIICYEDKRYYRFMKALGKHFGAFFLYESHASKQFTVSSKMGLLLWKDKTEMAFTWWQKKLIPIVAAI